MCEPVLHLLGLISSFHVARAVYLACWLSCYREDNESFVPTRSLPRPSVNSCEKRVAFFSIDEKVSKERSENKNKYKGNSDECQREAHRGRNLCLVEMQLRSSTQELLENLVPGADAQNPLHLFRPGTLSPAKSIHSTRLFISNKTVDRHD